MTAIASNPNSRANGNGLALRGWANALAAQLRVVEPLERPSRQEPPQSQGVAPEHPVEPPPLGLDHREVALRPEQPVHLDAVEEALAERPQLVLVVLEVVVWVDDLVG